jgi:thiamine pyrophosphokinase
MTEVAPTTPPVAYVFCGGDPPPIAAAAAARAADIVIAADSGLDHARSIGCPVDLVIGDLDSVSVAALSSARSLGVEVEEHPVDKDMSDLELAIDAAVARGAHQVVVAGGGGGRIDYVFGNALLVAAEKYAFNEMEQWTREARIVVVRGERRIEATPGAGCSIIAVGGPAEGVRTEGLRWTLSDETLDPGSSRGHSNVVEAPEITVSVEGGVLLVLLPTG